MGSGEYMTLRSKLPTEQKSSVTKKYPMSSVLSLRNKQVVGLTPKSIAICSGSNSIDCYDLETNETKTLKISSLLHFDSKITLLPGKRFAAAVEDKVKIYCSESRNLLKEIELPLKAITETGKSVSYNDLSVSLDGAQLCFKCEIYGSASSSMLVHKHEMYLIVDLDTDVVKTVIAEDDSQLQIINKNQLLLLSSGDKVKIEILNIESKEIERSKVKVERISQIIKVFAWPQHPSIWIVACETFADAENFDSLCCDLYTYHITTTEGKAKATKGEKIGTIKMSDILSNSLVHHHHAFTFKDAKKNAVVEFDLTIMSARELKYEGVISLVPKCIFPTGEFGIYGEEDGQNCLIVEEAKSMRNFEEAFEEHVDAGINGLGGSHVAQPLRRMIMDYAAPRLFWKKKELPVSVAATVEEERKLVAMG